MLAAMMLAGVLLRDVTPPADAWLVDHAWAAPGSRLAAVATAIGGVGTLLCLAALTAGAVAAAVVRRRAGRGVGYVARVLVTVPLAASVLLLQGLFLRPGPPQQPQVGTYPSGHVAVVTAIAFAAVLLYRELGRGWHRVTLAGGLTATWTQRGGSTYDATPKPGRRQPPDMITWTATLSRLNEFGLGGRAVTWGDQIQ